MDENVFQKILVLGLEREASDIHFEVGYPPILRIKGRLMKAKLPELSPADTTELAKMVMAHNARPFDPKLTETDVSYSMGARGRLRVSIFRQRGFFGLVMRLIPVEIRSFEELNLPPVMKDFANARAGLILVTGPTGMGKTTTINAMLSHVNHTRTAHILTIEDPIEFVHKPDKSIFIHREVGSDTRSFGDALRTAMRQDPDIIMVGELRDSETVDTALKAAETGHLILASVHTPDVQTTIHRLISFFPPEIQDVARKRLAECLVAIISQRLLLMADESNRIPAVEILRNTKTIQECLRSEERLVELPEFIRKGREDSGMQTFDQHLLELCKSKKITMEEALAATSSSDFERNLYLER